MRSSQCTSWDQLNFINLGTRHWKYQCQQAHNNPTSFQMIWGIRKALSELNTFVPLLMLVLRRCRLVTYMAFGPWSKRAKRDLERLSEFLLPFPVLKIRMFPLGWLANLECNRKVFHMVFCVSQHCQILLNPL